MSTMLAHLPLVRGKQANSPQMGLYPTFVSRRAGYVTLGESQTRLGDAILHRALTEEPLWVRCVSDSFASPTIIPFNSGLE